MFLFNATPLHAMPGATDTTLRNPSNTVRFTPDTNLLEVDLRVNQRFIPETGQIMDVSALPDRANMPRGRNATMPAPLPATTPTLSPPLPSSQIPPQTPITSEALPAPTGGSSAQTPASLLPVPQENGTMVTPFRLLNTIPTP
jgi:hypothetical protein